jgi:hypothetical protein
MSTAYAKAQTFITHVAWVSKGDDPCKIASEAAGLMRELLDERDELLAVLKDAVRGLTQGACFTCGSEPGCNIDCAGCQWVARAEAVIAKAEAATAPCADCGATGTHDAGCVGELARYLDSGGK